METKEIINQEKNRGNNIQELFDKAVKSCSRAARRDSLAMLPITAGVILMLSYHTNPPFQGVKIVAIVALVLLLIAYSVMTIKTNSRLAKARDVDELLHMHDQVNASMSKPAIAVLLLCGIAWMVLHYNGRFDSGFNINLIFVTSLLSWSISRIVKKGVRVTASQEIRQLKELLARRD